MIIFGRAVARSLGRSVARSLGRSVARSLDRSVARSLPRSLPRSLARLLELANYFGGSIFELQICWGIICEARCSIKIAEELGSNCFIVVGSTRFLHPSSVCSSTQPVRLGSPSLCPCVRSIRIQYLSSSYTSLYFLGTSNS